MKTLLAGIAFLCSTTGNAQASFTIHFDFNKHNLTTTAQNQVDSFLQAEKPNLQALYIQLNGHCDAIGSDTYNYRLSKQRVAAVKKYLLNKGVEAINIGDEIGHGKRKPLNENQTADERQMNRRVEISFFRVVVTEQPGEKTLKEKLADTATAAGSTIALRNINFVGGMHLFLPESGTMLKELLEAMNANPKLIIRIEGHICCEETKGDGLDAETGINNLSEARAKAVMDYLLVNGITANRVSYKGFGHSAPIYPYPEKTEEERIQNRRVEIKIIHK